jgi:hypothetical protein
MQRWFSVLVGAVTLGLALTATAGADDSGRKVYDARSIQGRWGFGGGGHGVAVPPLAPLPAAGLGTITFDGTGGCTVTSTVNLNGTIIGPIASQQCIYTVNPDGTGSSEAFFGTSQFPNPVRILFVIVDRGNELLIMNVDLFVAGYSAKRQ